MDDLRTKRRGSVSVETLSVLGVATAGLLGLTAIGGAVARDIADGGTGDAKGAAATPMLVGQQAALEDAARAAELAERARVAERTASLAEHRTRIAAAMAEEITPERARELRRMGHDIFEADARRVPTLPMRRFESALGKDTVLSVTDGLWAWLTGKELPRHPAWESFPELERTTNAAERLSPAEVRLAIAHESDSWAPQVREHIADVAADEERIPGPYDYEAEEGVERFEHNGQEFDYRPTNDLLSPLLLRLDSFAVYSTKYPWLKYDRGNVPQSTFTHITKLRDEVARDSELLERVHDSGMEVAFVDFAQLPADFGGRSVATVGHRLLINVGDGRELDVPRVLGAMDDLSWELMDEQEWRAADEAHYAADRVDAKDLLHDVLPLDHDEARAWNLFGRVDGGVEKERFTKAEMAEMVAEGYPELDLFTHGDVARYLEEHGHDGVANALRHSNRRVFVDALEFPEIDHVFGDNLRSTIGHAIGVPNLSQQRLFLNLTTNLRAWPDVVADFVRRVVDLDGQ